MKLLLKNILNSLTINVNVGFKILSLIHASLHENLHSCLRFSSSNFETLNLAIIITWIKLDVLICEIGLHFNIPYIIVYHIPNM